jgi:GNAT superfamily N-acetyltransferase
MLEIFPVETGEDIEIIKKLFVEYAESLGLDLGFQNFEEELADLPGCYAPPEGCLLLAKYQDKVAGCVGLRELSDGVCEMKRLYVKQKFRGLKIGKALAEAVIQQARKARYSCIRLDFIAPRTSESLYRSLGFKEIAPYEDIPIESAVFMELKLE